MTIQVDPKLTAVTVKNAWAKEHRWANFGGGRAASTVTEIQGTQRGGLMLIRPDSGGQMSGMCFPHGKCMFSVAWREGKLAKTASAGFQENSG